MVVVVVVILVVVVVVVIVVVLSIDFLGKGFKNLPTYYEPVKVLLVQ